jgi:hypothetical protein
MKEKQMKKIALVLMIVLFSKNIAAMNLSDLFYPLKSAVVMGLLFYSPVADTFVMKKRSLNPSRLRAEPSDIPPASSTDVVIMQIHDHIFHIHKVVDSDIAIFIREGNIVTKLSLSFSQIHEQTAPAVLEIVDKIGHLTPHIH